MAAVGLEITPLFSLSLFIFFKKYVYDSNLIWLFVYPECPFWLQREREKGCYTKMRGLNFLCILFKSLPTLLHSFFMENSGSTFAFLSFYFSFTTE